jgi:hypothetical protein
MDQFVEQLLVGHAAHVMADFPDNSVDQTWLPPPDTVVIHGGSTGRGRAR